MPSHWLQDEGWERLRYAETREPHDPIEMRSAQSKGPVKMWVCDEKKCLRHEFTYGPKLDPPVCYGGLFWSFTTTFYDPKIHRSPARL